MLGRDVLFIVVVSILLGGLSLGLPAYELHYRRKLRASLSWPQVTGTISRAGVEGSVGTYGSSIVARVTYQYEADGRPYEGTRISFSQARYSSKKEAQAALDPYPVNSAVTVYFDPAKPADAVLVREYLSSLRVIVFVYCCLALIAVCLVVLEHLQPDHPKPAARTQDRVEPWAPPPLVKEPPPQAPATPHR